MAKQLQQQPIPTVTPDDVERIIRRDFPADRFAEVLAIVNEDRLQDRVRVAALKLADGKLERLRVHIQSAKRDYRDILAAAEYPAYMKIGFRVQELAQEEQSRIVNKDWQQYDEWFRKAD